MNTQTASSGLHLDGRYQLITQIGSGGMSVVWYAIDEILGRHVAVKLLSASLAADPAFPRRLLTEARAVAALSHPHITTVHDFGVHRAADGHWTPYLVMELLDGEPLSGALQRGSMPWREAVTICAELASALHAAHGNGIVHRDVTPANVMLTSAGVKVLDFGISALIGDIQTGERAHVFGTAAYLAPERLIRGETTAAADVYAAGLVLYQCLAGHLPWPAQTIAETLYAHAHLQPHPLPLLGLPRAIEEICLRCLSREPHHRPSSAELADVLAREVHRIDAATIHLGEYAARTLARDGATATLPLAAPKRRLFKSRHALAGAMALCALALGYAAGAASPQLAAAQAQNVTTAAQCSATYAMRQLSNVQFEAILTVTNTGPSVPQWIVQFRQPAGEVTSSAQSGLQVSQQNAGNSPAVYISQQEQIVTVASTSAFDAGASVTQTLHGTLASIPNTFTLNGNRCDATIILAASTLVPEVISGPPVATPQVSTWDKPLGKTKPSKPGGKQSADQRT